MNRLVLADDSASMRALIRDAIGDVFGEVIEIPDGRELFWRVEKLYDSVDPHFMVISDHVMPGYNGLDVLEAWRSAGCLVPMILISAYPDAGVYKRVRSLGASLLEKPFRMADLRRTVEAVLRHGSK